MKDLFHAGPPFVGGAVGEWILAGFAEGPPAFGHGVGGEAGHIGGEVGADILEVTEEVVDAVREAAEKNGVVADVGLVDDAENVGPDGLVEAFVVGDFFGTKSEDAAVALHGERSGEAHGMA